MEKKYISVKEAAEYTGLSKWYLYKLTAKKAMPFRKVGTHRILIKKAELDGWLDKFKVNTKEAANGR